MSKKQQSRNEVKNNCEKLFSKSNLILAAATGVGKTFNSINLQHKMNSQKTFVCVAEIAHIQNWIDEYIKHGFEELLKTTEIFCYASLKKYQKKSCDLIICDEFHHISENRAYLLSTIKKNKAIGLSATVTQDDINNFEQIFGSTEIYNITMNDAIKMDILDEPEINIISLELDNSEYSEVILYQRGKECNDTECLYEQRASYMNNAKKYPNLSLVIRCTQQQRYNYIEGEYNRLKRMANISSGYKFKWLNYGNVRKKFLSDCKSQYIANLLSKEMINKRFICFCGSIEQADLLSKYIPNGNAIHSKEKDSLELINKFNDKEINNLFAVKMATEGMNLVDIEAAVIGQLDGTERTFIQRLGRSMRAEKPIIYIFYYKNTRDEEYLNNIIDGIDEKYIKRVNNFN